MSWAVVDRRLSEIEATIRAQVAVAPTWGTPVDLAQAAGIALDAWQQRVLRSTASRVIVLGPRQSGKSTVSASLSVHVALTEPDALVLLIAPSLRQSAELARTVRRLALTLGMAAIDEATPAAVSTTRIEFGNGSRVIALPGTSEATVRGYPAPRLIVCDEASRISEETYAAIRPSLAASPDGRLVLVSSPWLKSGTFYRTWAEGADGWDRVRVTTADCPRLSAGFLAQEKRELPSWVYAREYEGVFCDDDMTLFSAELIASCLDPNVRPLFGDAA